MAEFSIVTGVLVKNKAGKFLLVKKPDTVGPYKGSFLIPGGGVNEDESADQAAIRELYEETGVKVTNLQRVYFDDDITENWAGQTKHFIGLLYTADYASGDLQPTAGNDDIFERVGWFSPTEIRQMPLAPPLQKLVRHLGYLAQ